MAEETNYQDAGEQPPSTAEQQAPSVSEENAPSTTSDQATDIPTASAPDPKAVDPAVNPNAAGEKSSTESPTPDDSAQVQQPVKKTAQVPKGEKPAAKKEKAPAVEDKPFTEFIEQDYLPAVKAALAKQGVQDVELKFAKQKIPVSGLEREPECWQVMGSWQSGKRHFNLYFPEEDIQKQRAFSCANGSKPSTLESFLIDERKITLDLMVFGLIQRLNAQKWLTRN